MRLHWTYVCEIFDQSIWQASGKRSYIISRSHIEKIYMASSKTHQNVLFPFSPAQIDLGQFHKWEEASRNCQEFEDAI